MSGWKLALRIGMREFRRSKGRSILAVIMIALPICGIAAFSTCYASFSLTPQERLDRTIGTATASMSVAENVPIDQSATGENFTRRKSAERVVGPTVDARPTIADAAAKLLPAGSTTSPYWKARNVSVHTRNGIGNLLTWGLDLTNPLTRGIATVKKGAVAKGPGEVMLNAAASAQLGADIGGKVELTGDSVKYTVVGLVELPSNLRPVAVFAPVAQPEGSAIDPPNALLVGTGEPVKWEQVRQYNDNGILVVSREVITKNPQTPGAMEDYEPSSEFPPEDIAIVVVMVVVEVVLLVGPAFAIGAKRRRRELGLLAATGAAPAQIRRTVLADGLVAGIGGALGGIVVGVLSALAVTGIAEDHFVHRRSGAFRLEPITLLALLALAMLVGVLASLAPAIATARQEVLDALNGRTGSRRVSRRWLLAGLVICAAGCGLTVFGIGDGREIGAREAVVAFGLILLELGLVCCTPLVVSLTARLGGIMPLSGRMALRDAGRNRAAAVPAIAAITAAVAGSISAGVFLASAEARSKQDYEARLPSGYASIRWSESAASPLSAEVRAAVARNAETMARNNLPVARTAPMQRAECAPNGALAPGVEASCSAQLQIPAERRCPYVDGSASLTAEQRKAARRDTRCNGRNPWMEGGYMVGQNDTVDDGSNLEMITGATGTDLEQAIATLRAGGVVTSQASAIVDGKATVAMFRETYSLQGESSASGSSASADPTASAGGASAWRSLPPGTAASPAASSAAGAVASPSVSPSPSVSAVPSASAAAGGQSGEQSQRRLKPVVEVVLPAHLLTTGVQVRGVILPPSALGALQLEAHTSGLYVATSRMPSTEEEERLNGLFHAQAEAQMAARIAAKSAARKAPGASAGPADAAAGQPDLPPAYLEVERGYRYDRNLPAKLVTVLAVLVALGAAAVATGLIAADQRSDLSTLGAVGASPGVRRRLLFSNAGVISGLGSVMGIATGMGIGAALIAALNNRDPDAWPVAVRYPLEAPWSSVALVAVAVPLVAMAGAGLLSRSRLPIERRL